MTDSVTQARLPRSQGKQVRVLIGQSAECAPLLSLKAPPSVLSQRHGRALVSHLVPKPCNNKLLQDLTLAGSDSGRPQGASIKLLLFSLDLLFSVF